MRVDEIRLAKNERLNEEWLGRFQAAEPQVRNLASRYRGRDDCFVVSIHYGTYNAGYRLRWNDGGPDWFFRVPLPGMTMHPDEKVWKEVSAMTIVARDSTVPVPRLIVWQPSQGSENWLGLGPFILREWVPGRPLSEFLGSDSVHITPWIDTQILEPAYRAMADILLSLWQVNFENIGSCIQVLNTDLKHASLRPLTLEHNELMRCFGIPDCIPGHSYSTSAEYILSLVLLQLKHLDYQRNAVSDAEECERRYSCRHLMKVLAPRFISAKYNHGPFKLFCDGFSPKRVLVDEFLRVTGVINWEFCYAAPVEFASSIPSWFLQSLPEILRSMGVAEVLCAFLPRAYFFLDVLETVEVETNRNLPDERLSAGMRDSLDNRSAWFYLACRNASLVDLIYWGLLHEYYWDEDPAEFLNHKAVVGQHSLDEFLIRRKLKQFQVYNEERRGYLNVEVVDDQLSC
ncbi:hypothetical protein BDV25DRAFT_141045 [Aspergillus avenaceus]|uniref:Aminoglycoside phosphotransferase domain-containing protein n=1 Tax=Aspergillus avenaceus TaxID=36643 RepID=A0A5N6TS83_ASPAV|nr:hypothetical protein BDV25DRAFT_141045 [Aspergillus avenaceus]